MRKNLKKMRARTKLMNDDASGWGYSVGPSIVLPPPEDFRGGSGTASAKFSLQLQTGFPCRFNLLFILWGLFDAFAWIQGGYLIQLPSSSVYYPFNPLHSRLLVLAILPRIFSFLRSPELYPHGHRQPQLFLSSNTSSSFDNS
ncbi:hypothetical protein BDW75DRAFT_130206 [Aspergillus navahoensis]